MVGLRNKNFDGIKRDIKPAAVTKKKKNRSTHQVVYVWQPWTNRKLAVDWKKHAWRIGLPVVGMVVLAIVFFSGMDFALQTPKSVADNQPMVLAAETTTTTSDPTLFNTPIELLKNYFQSSTDANILANRKIQLQQYLTEKNSPLAADSDLIAEQPHWKLILAISFAESTLGKKCHDFNCSGIGGSSGIRSYKSLSNWILDFNRLLDKHYNNQTLEQMCGVYVQPCTNNWLKATKTILDELDVKGIK